MTAPVGLIEIEETEAPEVDAALLTEKVPTRRCACGKVRLGDQVAHRDDACRPIVFTEVEKAPYPTPEITSRDAWDAAAEPAPSAVAALAERARAARWAARVQRSRGCPPNSGTGAPTALKTLHGVVMSNGYASACAVHDGTKWSSVMLWSQDRAWFPEASVTDLGNYLKRDGRIDDAWLDGIRHREADKEARRKAREACNRGLHKGATLTNDTWTCPLCGNTWGVKEAAWRKAKSRKAEAL